MEYKLKLSEQPIKISNPGIHQVRRFFKDETYLMDVMYDIELGISDSPDSYLINDPVHHHKISDYDAFVDLLVPVFRKGKNIYVAESIQEMRKRAIQETSLWVNTQKDTVYPVGLESKLFEAKQKLIKQVANPKP